MKPKTRLPFTQTVKLSSAAPQNSTVWPAATRMAAERMDDETLAVLERLIVSGERASSQAERMPFDAEFHAVVARRSDNATLASMIPAVSSRTIRARTWRGVVDEAASARTVTQHPRRVTAARIDA